MRSYELIWVTAKRTSADQSGAKSISEGSRRLTQTKADIFLSLVVRHVNSEVRISRGRLSALMRDSEVRGCTVVAAVAARTSFPKQGENLSHHDALHSGFREAKLS